MSRDYYVPPDEWQGLMDANPGITVEYQVESNDDMLPQLQRMQDAGQRLPDVIQDDTFLMEAYQNADLLLDLTELKDAWEAEDPETYNQILPIAWEENEFADGVYGSSLTANFDIIYYNVGACEEAEIDCDGIDTLDGLLDAMRAVKASGDTIPLSVQALPGSGITTFKTFLSAAGAPFEGAVPDLQSEGGLYTIDWFLQAAEEGLLPAESVSWGEAEARGAFAGQRAAFHPRRLHRGRRVRRDRRVRPRHGLGGRAHAHAGRRQPDLQRQDAGRSSTAPSTPRRRCWRCATSAASSSSWRPPTTARCRCATVQPWRTRD